MKRATLHTILALLLSLILCSLQSHFYNLPFPAPALWVVVFCFFSFYRSLTLSLLFNSLLVFMLAQFSVMNAIAMILALNGLSFFAKSMQTRFHLAEHQVVLSVGPMTFLIQFLLSLPSLPSIFAFNYWSSLTLALSTAIFAPLIFYPRLRLAEKFRLDPLDSMEIFVS